MSSIELLDNQTAPLVSVIVPCYNSERTIARCLAAIINQQTSISFDVTVVDSSADNTPRIVEREFPSVRLIHLETRTYAGAARNVGLRATRSPYCLLIDSDCIARPDLIERMIAQHRAERYAAVGGSLANGTPRSLSGLVSYLAEFKEFMPSTPRRLVTTVPTANVTYRREALERFGFFDEDVSMAEDILFNWKLHSAGEHILFDPAIEVTHLNRTGWREVLPYQVRLGRSSAKARRLGALPGAFLLAHPSLMLLTPFGRTLRAARWLALYDLKEFLAFLVIWPLYLVAMSFWSFGFLREAFRKK
jgi:glycosyltransferase involved in cell wall biosynthesis